MNKERTELGDIDLDLCPSKRPKIINAIKKERGEKFNADIDDLSRKHLGCTLIATFGTIKPRSAVLTACRGYRGEGFPNGIDVNVGQYMSSLIPSERGQLWPLEDVIYGNEEKDRKPVKTFINEASKYPHLIETMLAIAGIIDKRSSHASGVILFDEDPYEFGCFMKTPGGDIITQYDLHMAEAAGMTKYDLNIVKSRYTAMFNDKELNPITQGCVILIMLTGEPEQVKLKAIPCQARKGRCIDYLLKCS